MKQYQDLCELILAKPKARQDRTGTGTVGIFGHQMRFDMAQGFPLLTTKKVFTRGVFEELKWICKGDSNIGYLQERGVKIWDQWANEQGEIGPMYPTMWRHFPNGVPSSVIQELSDLAATELDAVSSPSEFSDPFYTVQERIVQLAQDPQYKPIDQLQELLVGLKKRPFSRRQLVSAWHPSVLPDESKSVEQNVADGKQCLAACHTFFQVYVEELTVEEALALADQMIHKTWDASIIEDRLIRARIDALAQDALNNKDVNYTSEQFDEKLSALREELEQNNQRCDILEIRAGDILAPTPEFIAGLPRKRLSLQLYQRSADVPLGLPFNIASYAALLQILADKTDMFPGDFIWTGGDCHVYLNQIEKLRDEQLSREPRALPVLIIDYGTGQPNPENWDDIDQWSFKVIGYDPHPTVNFPLAAK